MHIYASCCISGTGCASLRPWDAVCVGPRGIPQDRMDELGPTWFRNMEMG